ncbi:MAG: sulfotransferase domain-containing protein [Patescibacteria group bacterium]|nr:sulfotransferase domain-containing protein [Patescibacteria group bacterium]
MAESDFKIDFVGVGAEKAGSSWVAAMLDAHPEICLSQPKEVQYFNEKSSYTRGLNANFNKGFGWYEKHFIHCKKNSIKGEFSTAYLPDKTAPKKIFQSFPGVKLIVCLRDPVDRMYSQYWMYKNYFLKEKRPFSEVVREEKEYTEKSLYFKQIKEYLKYFSLENILFITLDEIKENPKICHKALYKFVGTRNVDFVPGKGVFGRKNKAKRVRFRSGLVLINRLSKIFIFLGFSRVLKVLVKYGFKDFCLRIISDESRYPPIDKGLRSELIKKFISDIDDFERLTGKNLSSWKKT